MYTLGMWKSKQKKLSCLPADFHLIRMEAWMGKCYALIY